MQSILDIYNAKINTRYEKAIGMIDEFLETSESMLKWQSVKYANATLGLNKEHNSAQLLWIFYNDQRERKNQIEHEWNVAKYVADSICSFVNPNAQSADPGATRAAAKGIWPPRRIHLPQ